MIESNIDTVDITIDGKKIKANKNTNILQAAMDAGMYIPYLCYYPGMKSYGACRMCVVEVEGGRGAPASCTTPVADGMKINTQTDELGNEVYDWYWIDPEGNVVADSDLK